MSRKEDYEEKTWELLVPILEELSLKAVDVEFLKEGPDYYLRVYIDKDGGVGINDCEEVSRRLDPMLDEEDFIDDPYILEVSSPGLGRPLRRPRDFIFAMNREIELRTFKKAEDGGEFRGILRGYDDAHVTVELEDGEREFARKDLSMIRMAADV